MRAHLNLLCRLAPYVALAALGIFELIDTTTMIVLAVALSTVGTEGRCLPASRA